MVRIFFLAAGLSCLGACSWSGPGSAGGSSWQSGIPSSQGFRFDWQLSGDPAVAPLQVFDDGRETWLQFLPGQPLPAIFGMGDGGEHPLPYVRRDPYVVVAGAWNGLSFRGGRLTARARRAHAAANPAREPASASRLALSTAAEPDPSQRPPLDASAAITLSADTPARSDGHAPAGPPVAPQAAPFRAAPPDATLRAVLARWADSAGWTFQPQHWAVDVDIPLAATAEFPGDFKAAVRGLLGATELADRPLQPCFYGNRVLRVVPLAQSCSRAATPKGAAA
ncbi:TcpQ domain-containing protein [Achromobacter mucicolens]|uniref:TcpQ domain-containing protein n=1 Tax=Achromobacter mucicolens TaxID=1389922 RepID=UPI00244B3771|nr:TcpQ domain-containing protein [Achromobacter mucicolens]MDH1522226.1 TcpQ domain-containing protein [Achromobacter mucicolens]